MINFFRKIFGFFWSSEVIPVNTDEEESVMCDLRVLVEQGVAVKRVIETGKFLIHVKDNYLTKNGNKPKVSMEKYVTKVLAMDVVDFNNEVTKYNIKNGL